jgi:hypothetical protein
MLMHSRTHLCRNAQYISIYLFFFYKTYFNYFYVCVLWCTIKICPTHAKLFLFGCSTCVTPQDRLGMVLFPSHRLPKGSSR